MRKELITFNEQHQTLNSLHMSVVRSYEITLKEMRDPSGSFSISAGAQSIPKMGSDGQTILVTTTNSDAPTIPESINSDVHAVAKDEGALSTKDTVNSDDASSSHEDSILVMTSDADSEEKKKITNQTGKDYSFYFREQESASKWLNPSCTPSIQVVH